MSKTVQFVIGHYIDDNFYPSRTLTFATTADCLKDCLTATGDPRNVESLMDFYDSDDALEVYEYALDNNMIVSQEIEYCDEFVKEYSRYVASVKYPLTPESYYWCEYCGA